MSKDIFDVPQYFTSYKDKTYRVVYRGTLKVGDTITLNVKGVIKSGIISKIIEKRKSKGTFENPPFSYKLSIQ